MKMPFEEDTFDAIYAIEATCHAPDAVLFLFKFALLSISSSFYFYSNLVVLCSLKVGCYKEVYRVLKPGQHFAAYEWCMTESYSPTNENHQKIKAEIELGNGLTDIRTTSQCLNALKEAGFEVITLKQKGMNFAR